MKKLCLLVLSTFFCFIAKADDSYFYFDYAINNNLNYDLSLVSVIKEPQDGTNGFCDNTIQNIPAHTSATLHNYKKLGYGGAFNRCIYTYIINGISSAQLILDETNPMQG